MKRLFLLAILALCLALTATAEEKSMVIRNGNTYYIEHEAYSKLGFRSYLKYNYMPAYKQFNYGYNLSIAGWTCLAVGYTKMHKSADLYNQTCAKPKVTLSLDATTDGIGLGMKF